jgi:hypothetical protein
MQKLFSYVVHHDYGFAPNPFGGFCTLAKCKYGSKKKPNIIEMANEGDWIAGTGGADIVKSSGRGKLIFAMKVDEKIPLLQYCRLHAGKRVDADLEPFDAERFALISRHFFYFGRNAIDISEIPDNHLDHAFEKTGPGYRCDFSAEFIEEFASWLGKTFSKGVHGQPCMPQSNLPVTNRCVKRKKCN